MGKSQEPPTSVTYAERIAELLEPLLEIEQRIRAATEELMKHDEQTAAELKQLADILSRYARSLAVRIAKREDGMQTSQAKRGLDGKPAGA